MTETLNFFLELEVQEVPEEEREGGSWQRQRSVTSACSSWSNSPSIARAAAPSPSPRNRLSVLSDGLRTCLFYADCAENFKQIFNSHRKMNAAVEPIISICLLAYQTQFCRCIMPCDFPHKYLKIYLKSSYLSSTGSNQWKVSLHFWMGRNFLIPRIYLSLDELSLLLDLTAWFPLALLVRGFPSLD